MEQIVIRKIGILRMLAQIFFMGRSLAESHPAKQGRLTRDALIVSSLGLCAAMVQREKKIDQILHSAPQRDAKLYDARIDMAYVENPLKGAQAQVLQPQPLDHAAMMMDIHH